MFIVQGGRDTENNPLSSNMIQELTGRRLRCLSGRPCVAIIQFPVVLFVLAEAMSMFLHSPSASAIHLIIHSAGLCDCRFADPAVGWFEASVALPFKLKLDSGLRCVDF